MNARPPTEREINIFDSLDERSAVKNFLWKSLEEARSLFRDNFLHYQEDLMWMGPIAFRFYVVAAINYLLSEDATDAADAVSTFCMVLKFRLDEETAEIAPVGPILRDAIFGILNDFDRYGADIAYYGDVAGRYRALLARLEDLTPVYPS